MSHLLSKIIITLLTLLGCSVLIGEFFNLHIYFPLNVADNEKIPYHRMQSIRLSLILTFIYFGIRYIFFQSHKMYPIQFFNIYLKSLTICSLLVFYTFQVSIIEYYFVIFFFLVSTVLHFASKPEIRNYFKK